MSATRRPPRRPASPSRQTVGGATATPVSAPRSARPAHRGCVSASDVPCRGVRIRGMRGHALGIPGTAQLRLACSVHLALATLTYRRTSDAQLACGTPQLIAIPFDVQPGAPVSKNDRLVIKCTAHCTKIGSPRALFGALRCISLVRGTYSQTPASRCARRRHSRARPARGSAPRRGATRTHAASPSHASFGQSTAGL